MIRHLIPRIEFGTWAGSGLTLDPEDTTSCPHDDVAGHCLVIQWLGLIIEVAVGRVTK